LSDKTQRWETREEIAAAKRRFEAGLPGWAAPSAYGVGHLTDGSLTFVRINVGDHVLPALVLATVLGHGAGSASYRLTAEELGRAIELLAPAEACTAYDHPNLEAWRSLHGALGEVGEAVAVFVGDLDEPRDDQLVEALRHEALRQGQLPRP